MITIKLKIMANQTLIEKDQKYPVRFRLSDQDTDWNLEVDYYNPPYYPDFDLLAERLAAKGVEVPDIKTLSAVAKLSTAQAAEIVGPAIVDIRHPLGRTGINGSGIYYNAGKSQTADLAVIREIPNKGRQIALVFNRSKWRLPGGFMDPEDYGNHRRTALREGYEEINLDLANLSENGHFNTLIPEHIKPNSSRSADLGYLTTQVEVVVLPVPEIGDDLKAGDDAEDAAWVYELDALELGRDRKISKDHYQYITQVFEFAKSSEN